MATPTPGTFPSFPPYQPGALQYTGSEIFLLVTSATATAAATYYDLVTNMVGKVPGVLPNASPAASDLITFLQAASGLPMATQVGNLGVQAGNLPIGGGTGQLLAKSSATNFIATWISPSAFVTAGTGIVVSGSTTLTLSVMGGTFGGIGNPTGSVSLAAVNGIASTVMASDSAPALNVGIAPTWTGQHTFSATTVMNGGLGLGTSVLGSTVLKATGTAQVASLGIGTANATNRLDVAGGVAIGAYAGTNAAQANGLIVSGAVGIGTSNPGGDQFYVTGGTTVINATAIFNGNVAIGTTIPGPYALNIVNTALVGYLTVAAAVAVGTAVVYPGAGMTLNCTQSAAIMSACLNFRGDPTSFGLASTVTGPILQGIALNQITEQPITLIASQLNLVPLGGPVAIGTTNAGGAALDVNGLIKSDVGFARVTTAFNVVSTTTLAEISALSVAVASNANYFFEAILYCTAGATGGTQLAIQTNTTPTSIIYDGQSYSGGSLVAQGRATSPGVAIATSTSATTPTIRVVGTLSSGTATVFYPQIAQAAATTTTTVVLPGSTMKVFQIN
jgi:hypothetical protein